MKVEKCKITKYPEIAKEVEKLKAQGYGLRAISEIIKRDYNVEFSHQTVANYLDSKGALMTAIFEADEDLKQKAMEKSMKKSLNI
jgi:predicted nucleotide-binding protein